MTSNRVQKGNLYCMSLIFYRQATHLDSPDITTVPMFSVDVLHFYTRYRKDRDEASLECGT